MPGEDQHEPEMYLADAPAPVQTEAPGQPTAEAEPAVVAPPLTAAQRAKMQELAAVREAAAQRFEAALGAQEQLAARLAEMPESAVGEELDGDVRVSVDQRGMLTDVRFGAGVTDVAPDQLGGLVMTALRTAQQGLQRSRPSPDATARLHDDTLAVALRALISPDRSPGEHDQPGEPGEPDQHDQYDQHGKDE